MDDNPTGVLRCELSSAVPEGRPTASIAVSNILAKLGVANRSEAVTLALRSHLVD